VYDARNPYFSGSSDWPGWVAVLEAASVRRSTTFAAISWQRLLARGHLSEGVVEWVRERHRMCADPCVI
jgi:hypothetical protein